MPNIEINLNRIFCKLDKKAADVGEYSEYSHLWDKNKTTWSDLLLLPRVVILAQAGAGKTYEMKAQASTLRARGLPAFFIRIEHLTSDIELAFEGGDLGNYEEFNIWLGTDEKAYFFLDSIDEAKLVNISDFDLALKRFKLALKSRDQDAHIYISSRPTFEPKSEIDIIKRYLPYKFSRQEVEEQSEDKLIQVNSLEANLPVKTNRTKYEEAVEIPIIYSIKPLDSNRIKKFAKALGVINVEEFFDALKRSDAEKFAKRPRDLEGIVSSWLSNHKIGTKLDIIQADLERRIVENDANRATKMCLTKDKVLRGIQTIAAVTTLSRFSRISVPRKDSNSDSISLNDVLPDWKIWECEALLQRPLFDEAAYGTVRFHDREIREYLAAQWFEKLIQKGAQNQIENLFFHTQYGINLTRPKLRSILPWVALHNDHFRMKALKISPSDLLSGGDPAKYPLEFRIQLLEATCKEIYNKTFLYHSFDVDIIQRFASEDIAGTVLRLLEKYKEHEEIRQLLLKLIWQGELKICSAISIEFAVNTSFDEYTRLYAIRACHAVLNDAQSKQLISSIIPNITLEDRQLIDEVVDYFVPNILTIRELLHTLKTFESLSQYSTDHLKYALNELAKRLSKLDLETFLTGLTAYLFQEPFIEKESYSISSKYYWMAEVAIICIERLVTFKSAQLLEPRYLKLMSELSLYSAYGHEEELKTNLRDIIPTWKVLNDKLFWFEASKPVHKDKDPITSFFMVSPLRGFWSHKDTLINDAISWIRDLDNLNQKQVALSLAFAIYRDIGRPRTERLKLWRVVKGNETLEKDLYDFLHPAKNNVHNKWQIKHRKRKKRREKKEEQDRLGAIKYATNNLDKVGYLDGISEDVFYPIQRQLLYRMRKEDNGLSTWTRSNWEIISKDFGKDVGRAFRGFLVNSWKHHSPKLNSETTDESNSTPYATIFGLCGLKILDEEEDEWITQLSEAEVNLVCRFAMSEISKPPIWFEKLYSCFPQIVIDIIYAEISWEISNRSADQQRSGNLHDIFWFCEWIWKDLSKQIFLILKKQEPKHHSDLQACVSILLANSEIKEFEIAELAQNWLDGGTEHYVTWLAVLVSVTPTVGISKIKEKISSFPNQELKTKFAMQFVVELMGGRHSKRTNYRTIFETPDHLENLYLLMNKYIPMSDDINRANTGGYTPKLRDEAQEARGALLMKIVNIPGKKSYLALKSLVKKHPHEEAREWMKKRVLDHAEKQADLAPMSVEDIHCFHNQFENTPASAKELFFIAKLRLNLLKVELEDGEDSPASSWQKEDKETNLRVLIAKWLRDKSNRMYSIHQEEEQTDGKRPDIRFNGLGFDAPVPVELKISGNWTGPQLFERLENQLCNDYLRDYRTNHGVFLLVNRKENKHWLHPKSKKKMTFEDLIQTLSKHAKKYIENKEGIENIQVLGIDLTKRNIEERIK